MKFFKKGDVFLIVAVLIIIASMALITFFAPHLDKRVTATVYVQGEVEHVIELSEVSEPYEITINNARIRVEKDRICFLSSDCPDKTCVRSGWLNKYHTVSACVPKGIVIVVQGDVSSPDGITG